MTTRTADQSFKVRWLATPIALGLALAGCSNGEGGTAAQQSNGDYVALANANPDADDSELRALALTRDTNTVSTSNGTLDRSEGEVVGTSIAGDINDARTIITLPGGGTVTLTNPANTDYARLFEVEEDVNMVATRTVIGVVGEPTEDDDMPSTDIPINTGSTYNGNAIVTITDGPDDAQTFFDLTGDAEITADFVNGEVDVTIDNLNGTSSSSETGPGGVSTENNVATITIEDALISGTGFSGGTASVDSNRIVDLTNDPNLNHSGQFYGPIADEVGGVLVLTDNDAGRELEIEGAYIGD